MTADLLEVHRSQRKLSEVTKYLVKPAGIADTGWTAVNRQCRRKMGIRFDGWQNGAGQLMLSTREDGRLATAVGGFGMSVPRQVGKTFFFAGGLFGLSIIRPNTLSLWSAHHGTTHGETFIAMQAFCERPRVAPFVRKIYTGSGDEQIVFTSGSRIMFGAREHGFGRGIPNVDAEIFDEAQILSDKALEDMLAAMNRSQLGLHAYIGTPPKPGDNCEAFERMRTEARSGLSTDLVWIECGADDDAELDDRDQWLKANPSYPHWTSDDAIMRLRRKLKADGFRREALGIWPKIGSVALDVAKWSKLEDADAPAPARAVLVVDVAEFQTASVVGVAGDVDGKTLVMCHCGPGTNWVADKVADLVATHDIAEVNLMPGEARGIAGDLTEAGVQFRNFSGVEMAASCSAIRKSVNEVDPESPQLMHVGQLELDGAVSKARTRRSASGLTWEDGTDPAVRAVAAAFHRWQLQDEPMPAFY